MPHRGVAAPPDRARRISLGTSAARGFNEAVLSEEGLILLLAGLACVLLVMGVLELVWPTRTRRLARRRPAGPPPRPGKNPPAPQESRFLPPPAPAPLTPTPGRHEPPAPPLTPATRRPAAPRPAGVLEDCVAAADRLLDHARSHPAAAGEERLQALRQALSGLAQGPGPGTEEGRLAARVAAVEGELWPAWEAVAVRLIKQQEYTAARRLLREGLEHPRVPAGRAAAFQGHFVETFSGEIGQLTARAMRSLQEGREADALKGLQRAEKLLGALRDDALPAARRQEVERRLWSGYTRLGMRRLAAGDPGTAIDALAQALRYDAGAERRVETRALLTRALEGLVDAAALVIREHADRGDTGAALEACDGLWERLRGATDLGLGPQEMATSVARVQALVETVGGRQP